MLGKTEGRRRSGQQRMRWLDGITTQWTWVWANPGRWWKTGKPGVLQSTGSLRVGHDWATEPNWMFWEENSCLFQGWVLKGIFHKLQSCSCMQTSVCAKALQSCPTLCNPVGCSPPGSYVHGILHGVGSCRAFLHGIFPIQGLSNPGIDPATLVSCIGRQILYH